MFLNYFKGRSQNEKNCCILTPSFLHTFSVCLPEKLPRWKDLAADLEKKIENKSHDLNMSQIKWMSWVSSDYLTSCGLHLQSVCKNDGCNGCESGIAWISNEAGSGNPNSYRENVCRGNGKYDFICHITHILIQGIRL